jgi:import inner membrane translocase subunit TIM16
MARYIAQIIMEGGQVVARAFARALREEMQAGTAAKAAASESGKDATKTVKHNAYTGMSIEEALQILNVKDVSDVEAYTKNYDHLFKINDKSSGGSFYLQSKVRYMFMHLQNARKHSWLDT